MDPIGRRSRTQSMPAGEGLPRLGGGGGCRGTVRLRDDCWMSSIDSRFVTSALRSALRPVLKAAGFTAFTGKKAWRYDEHTIDHIAFLSMNDYTATGVGCTTFSFTGEAGVLYRALEPVTNERPAEYSLTFRGRLNKTVRQPIFHPYGQPEPTDRTDVWYVLPDGSNIDEVVTDAVKAATDQGIPWIDRLIDPLDALEALRSERSTFAHPQYGTLGTWFPGNPASPHWLNVHSGLSALRPDPVASPASAPVLTSAERWLAQFPERYRGAPAEDAVRSAEQQGLRVALHQLPLPLLSTDRDHVRADDLLNVFVNPDGTVRDVR